MLNLGRSLLSVVVDLVACSSVLLILLWCINFYVELMSIMSVFSRAFRFVIRIDSFWANRFFLLKNRSFDSDSPDQ